MQGARHLRPCFYFMKITEIYKKKLDGEEGWILKRGAQLRIALCYPNVYEIGMANLGFQAMYELFNNMPEVSCERVFLPDSVRTVSVGEGSSASERARSPRVSKGSSSLRGLSRNRATQHPRNGSGYEALAHG